MSVGKVKDFNFSSAGKTVGMKMGGGANCYSKGGKVSDAPRMMRKEVMVRETVKAPSAPREMIKNRGSLGVVGNKNPGETRNNTAPNLPGKMMLKKGGMATSKAKC